MKRKLPNLSALECFDAVMKTGHVTQAAHNLNLTQSAVSRQIKTLESFVQQPLFKRQQKRLLPTEAAIEYANALTPILDQLETQTLKLLTWSAYDKVLTVGLLPTFGSRWLIPKLGSFTSNNPDIQINIATGLTHDDFVQAKTDVALQYGDGVWTGYVSHKIHEEHVVAVAAPALIERMQDANLDEYDHLHMRTRPSAWQYWFDARGNHKTKPKQGTQFENFTMMIEAVRSGLGAAVLPQMYIADDIKAGNLQAHFGKPVKSKEAYYLVYAEHLEGSYKVSAFRKWILGIS
ncbi:LysR substrate-binding domain-containing protein [Kordiimonas aquimaris]|uniref:LysR substrate-binding domain-containing protein n=1 Tax=Kordiimonas aquimaris TaxID=707591 RepID=UPI0021D0E89D|nr:LysR substrate-binding domain-containing protein [Kordiimonas aquimaris]